MKRFLALSLSLVLLLTLLPVSVSAGGGGAGLYHEFDFDTVSEFNKWTVIDANADGYSFARCRDGADPCYASSDMAVGEIETQLRGSDDYFISPPVYLSEGQEYSLYYRAGGTKPANAYSQDYEIYVYTGDEELTAANLYTELGIRAKLDWVSESSWTGYRQMDLTAYAGETVRIIFRNRRTDNACLWLDDVRIYWQEPDELLSKVTALNVPMPAVGLKARDLRESDIRFPDFANYTLISGSMTWYEIIDEVSRPMSDQTFTADGEYYMKFRVKPKTGITATDTGVASVNGENADFTRQSDGTVLVTYIPNRRFGESREVRDVHIRLDAPQPGQWPDQVAERWMPDGSGDFHWTVIDINWSPWNSPLQAGETYEVSLNLEPDPGWEFSDYVHVTLNGEPMYQWPEEFGFSISKSYESIQKNEVVVTFDNGGHGTAPAPLRVPFGGCLWDVIESPDDLAIPDTDGLMFSDWSTDPHSGRSGYFHYSEPITEDITLYPIWLKPLQNLELWLDPPAPGSDVEEVLLRADKYDQIHVETIGWYTDPEGGSDATAFLPGGTYYAFAFLEAGNYNGFPEGMNITLHGASLMQTNYMDSVCTLKFRVEMPRRYSTISKVALSVDTPVTGASMSMAPDIYCLTPGVDLQVEGDWWDSLDAVGDYDWVWGGGFRPGMTLYTVVSVSSREYALAAVSSLQTEVFGAKFCRFDGYNSDNSLRIVLSVTLPQTYGFTIWAEGPGLFHFSGEPGLVGICDFGFVPGGDYTLTAHPRENCSFVGWYDGDTLLSTEPTYAFTLKGNVDNWRAVFTETEIRRIDVSLPIPKPGDMFGYWVDTAGAVVTNGAPVILRKDVWYTEWGVSGTRLPFNPGWRYFVELEFTAKEGAYLSENTQVYINGEPAKAWQQANTSLWYAVSRNYAMNPFSDVAEGKYYFDAVMWAISHDPPVTTGTDATHFSPKTTCKREQVMTFLWNAVGSPEPETTENPFTDVKPSKYYYKAVLWAVENGITTGATPTTFGVGKECTRAQVMSFLWIAVGSPEPKTTQNPFTDVKPTSYYYKAVLWAVENGICTGTTATTFSPKSTCTRGQIVTFLYNVYGE